MRAPIPWIRDFVDLPANLTGRELSAALINLGLEVETVDVVGEVNGPVVFARVVDIEELTEFKKPIRYCQVDVGAANGGRRGIVCGARNFEVGDGVVVALAGAVLPGGFEIADRETYGRVSQGMICSTAELGLGQDAAGILVLPVADDVIGEGVADELGFNTEVLDIAVTPDRGYALSIRGIAREAAIAFSTQFNDRILQGSSLPAPGAGEPVECGFDQSGGCDVFTARTILGVNCAAPTPWRIQQRLVAAGMRPVSLVVDITNYVMLETGQPLHAFDAQTLAGSVQAREAIAGEKLETLDHVSRELDPEDLVIADETGPIALAGTMGGSTSEISESSQDIVLEAAHFDPIVVARMARRHKLSSEASRRFERGVDPTLAPYASELAAALIIEHGGGQYIGMTAHESPHEPVVIEVPADMPARVAGAAISAEQAVQSLEAVGCDVDPNGLVTPPPWRPDLRDPADFCEEVIRLFGYDNVPSRLPRVTSGLGLTHQQVLRRRIRKYLAAAGLHEVLNYPFTGEADLEALLISGDDGRASLVKLSNPLSEEQPGLRTTLLPGLLAATKRNVSRGAASVLVFEVGAVFSPGPGVAAKRPSVAQRPSDAELTELDAALPSEHRSVAGVLSGEWESAGWWGKGRAVEWSDAIRIARDGIHAFHLEPTTASADSAPFHPGRCAQLSVGDVAVGFAGELHPRVVANLGLPDRTCAFELDLDCLVEFATGVRVTSAAVLTFPVAKADVALVVDEAVTAGAVKRALAYGAGPLLESVRLFDVYRGDQLEPGKKSLAFALRMRAADRTLHEAEVGEVRTAAIEAAITQLGASLRA